MFFIHFVSMFPRDASVSIGSKGFPLNIKKLKNVNRQVEFSFFFCGLQYWNQIPNKYF